MKICKNLRYIGFAVPLLLAVICIISVTLGSQQAILPVPMPQELIGEYSYDGVSWYPLTAEADLSARNSDLFLRGTFLREMKEGWRLNFYRNHIGVSIKVNGALVYRDAMLDIPDLKPRVFASMCAREWMIAPVPGVSTQDTVEIHLHNPHIFGNQTAYRDFLTTLCSDQPGWDFLEQKLESYGNPLRVAGGLLIIVALMLLGAAVAAVIVHISVGSILLKPGLLTLFVGGFVCLDTIDISFWSQLNIWNTYAQQLCMMLAVFCLDSLLCDHLTSGRRTVTGVLTALSAALNSVLILLSPLSA